MSLDRKVISGTKWTTIASVAIMLISMIRLAVLARYVDKEDFGLMAIVTVVLGFMSLFMDMGITSAILHKQNITKEQYASLYWLNFGFSLVLMLLIIAIGPLVASFYQEQSLTELLALMSLSLLFAAIGRQFRTIEEKALNFRFISLAAIIGSFIALPVSIFLAMEGYGVYALVYGALTQFFLSNILYFIYGIRRNGLLWFFRFDQTRPFLRIGIYQVGGQVVNYFNRDLDTLLIGYLLGAEILGGYSLAKQLVFKPVGLINPIVTRVAAPALALIQDKKEQLASGFLRLVKLVSSINFMAYAAIAIFAYPLVEILYGDEYVGIVGIVRILCIYLFLRAVINPIGVLVVATGRTRSEFLWNLLALVVMPIFVFVGAKIGAEGVAWALVVFMFVALFPLYSIIVRPVIAVSFNIYLESMIPSPYGLIEYWKRFKGGDNT